VVLRGRFGLPGAHAEVQFRQLADRLFRGRVLHEDVALLVLQPMYNFDQLQHTIAVQNPICGGRRRKDRCARNRRRGLSITRPSAGCDSGRHRIARVAGRKCCVGV